METTDFGRLALLVNESCGIKGKIHILTNGKIAITWDEQCWHEIKPLDLQPVLITCKLKLKLQLTDYDKDNEPMPLSNRIINDQIADIAEAIVLLKRLNDWQKENSD